MATGPVNPTIGSNPIAAPATTGKAGEAKNVNKSDSDGSAMRSAQTKGNYEVQISGKARENAELQKNLFDAAQNSPDIREDRVADLKSRIASGNYQIDSGKIADSMLREAVRDHLALTDK